MSREPTDEAWPITSTRAAAEGKKGALAMPWTTSCAISPRARRLERWPGPAAASPVRDVGPKVDAAVQEFVYGRGIRACLST